MKKYLILLIGVILTCLTSCTGTYEVTTSTPVYTYYTPYYMQPPVRVRYYRPTPHRHYIPAPKPQPHQRRHEGHLHRR